MRKMKILPKGWKSEKFEGGEIYIDFNLTPALIQEGYSNEIVRRVQDMRKALNCKMEDYINVYLSVPQDRLKLKKKWIKRIMREVRAYKLYMNAPIANELFRKDWNIEIYKIEGTAEKIPVTVAIEEIFK